MIEFLETERLILRPFTLEDSSRLFLLDSNPEVMKYIGMEPLKEEAESKEVIQKILKQYQDNNVGRLAVIEKESNLLIGWSGMKLLTEPINNYVNVLDLGYRFLPECWGKGYATESAKAALKFGFNKMNAEIIYAHAYSENLASNHTLRKLGFQKTEQFVEPDGICNWYELKKENFRI